ncbi:MAG: hypothetical protein K8M05_12655 [Deltaproteobacteria bacterium]|nr:hypothetical protein [Kofleriaceae bacterium]
MAKPNLVLALVAALVALALAPSPAAAQEAPTCRLAGPPPPPDPDPAKRPPFYHSPMRQACEDELSKDPDWWFSLEGRLRTQIHVQTSREVSTNNRHVVLAYGAIWIIAVAFIVLLWRKQVALRAEIERLSRDLTRAEGGGDGGKGAA